MAAYAVLGVIAWFLLEGNFRYAILILFGLFAMRSIVAVKGGMVSSQTETLRPESNPEEEQ